MECEDENMTSIIVLCIIVVAFCVSIGLIVYGNDNISDMLTDDVNILFEDNKKNDDIEIL